MRIFSKYFIVMLLLTGVVVSLAAFQRSPQKFKNLKVLPKDISEQALNKIMDRFNYSLGVNCNYCHAKIANSSDLQFASDGKSEKETARDMMRMTDSINKKYFNFSNASSVETVSCFTCHQKNPVPLPDTTR